MYKKKRVGLIIWGGVLIMAGLLLLTASVRGAMTNTSKLSDILSPLVLAVMLFSGGGIMITFGIINAVKVTRYNSELKSRDLQYSAFCMNCGYNLICMPEHFRPHRRYPEGCTTCPVCKRPVSLNAFKVTERGK